MVFAYATTPRSITADAPGTRVISSVISPPVQLSATATRSPRTARRATTISGSSSFPSPQIASPKMARTAAAIRSARAAAPGPGTDHLRCTSGQCARNPNRTPAFAGSSITGRMA